MGRSAIALQRSLALLGATPVQVSAATSTGSDSTLTLTGFDLNYPVVIYVGGEDCRVTVDDGATAASDAIAADTFLPPMKVAAVKHQAVSSAGTIIAFGWS